ncbi:hypothetical protein K8352_01890 [Flavobacteriaceae bacterium F89]|uniref:Uncharacterized protein n=1 Tax=Cerina litoralis TaxID=2874477 RepID=A0AAE3JN41_9FLAO|nr:hypothetical protein [Cerina litoralis]MCG2459494.1 hypothetical protein [Cerina litoralis]
MTTLARILLILLLWAMETYGQSNLEFSGQASAFGNYSPDSELNMSLGARYIPQLEYKIPLDSLHALTFMVSVNIYGSTSFSPFYKNTVEGDFDPYRIWARYSGERYEIRLGLQKMDFGSATLLRPLQWFNQIDPRDPLGLTNGVYGALGRYYFPNNANIWIWGLYGNEKPRGYDAVGTYKKDVEVGGRFQYPVPKGELAISYHHRTADATNILNEPSLENIPEDRIGLDGKWDVTVGLWFETSYIHKHVDLGSLTNQTLITLGTDYTFGIGNGLNVVLEHMITSFNRESVKFSNNTNITAINISYPMGLSDNLSMLPYYDWEGNNFSFFLNYQHQFKKLTGYVMAYYNPDSQTVVQENELVNVAAGPGFRLMLVYNH